MRVYKGIFKCKSKRLFETQNSMKNWKNYAKVYIRESRDRYENECSGWYLSRDSGVTRRGARVDCVQKYKVCKTIRFQMSHQKPKLSSDRCNQTVFQLRFRVWPGNWVLRPGAISGL